MNSQGLKLRSDAQVDEDSPSGQSELEEFEDSPTYDPVTSLGADVPTSRLDAPTYAVAQKWARKQADNKAIASAWVQGTTSFIIASLGFVGL